MRKKARNSLRKKKTRRKKLQTKHTDRKDREDVVHVSSSVSPSSSSCTMSMAEGASLASPTVWTVSPVQSRMRLG